MRKGKTRSQKTGDRGQGAKMRNSKCQNPNDKFWIMDPGYLMLDETHGMMEWWNDGELFNLN